jgi:hypothetical protein
MKLISQCFPAFCNNWRSDVLEGRKGAEPSVGLSVPSASLPERNKGCNVALSGDVGLTEERRRR